MSRPVIQVYFDVVSPYSLFGVERLLQLNAHWKLPIKWKPMFLGGVMNSSSNKPPATVPAKGVYMLQDLRRHANYFGVKPISMPSVFPVLTIKPMRLLTAIDMSDADDQVLVDAALNIWEAYWRQGKDISDAQVVEDAVGTTVYNRYAPASVSDAVKERLKEVTQEAVDHGAFGAPTFIINGHMYFGCDRFHHIAQDLNLQYPPPGLKNKL